MDYITIPKNDRGYTITFHCQDRSGNIYVYDTANAITLKAWAPSAPDTVLVSAACALTNATSGDVTYTIGSGHWRSSMNYTAELEFSRSGNVVESIGPFQIKVAESA